MIQTEGEVVGTRRPILILLYHQIGTHAPLKGHLEEVLIPRERFERQMRAMHAIGFQGLSLSRLEPYLRGEKCGRVFGITMDDGYLDCLHHALPVLQRFNFSATCYAVSGRATNEWDLTVGVPELPLMGAPELRSWIAAGNDVGGHTRTHRPLPDLDDATAQEEIAGCKQDLERMTGVEVRHFSYPYGRFTPRDVALVRDAGYTTATTSISFRASRRDNLLALPRVCALPSTGPRQVWMHALTGTENLRGWLERTRGRSGDSSGALVRA